MAKVGAMPKGQKAQVLKYAFEKIKHFLGKTHKKVSQRRKSVFNPWKRLHQFRYSVLRQMRALFFQSYGSTSIKHKLLRVEGPKFGYSVLGQMGALVFELLPPPHQKAK